MKKILLLLLFSLTCYTQVDAQYNTIHNKVWAMGKKIGLDFRGTGDPIAIVSALDGLDNEGCASVCDSSGKFLFYSNGNKVWDSTGTLMPNGGSLPGYSSATQGVLIVPVIGSSVKYYLFLLSHFNGFQKLHCKLVDMTLNGGRGDIDTNFALNNTILVDSLSEKMVAVRGCNKDVWVVVHVNNADVFYAFNVTVAGVNLTPVVSSFPNALLYFYGVMKASPAGDRLLICTPGLKTYDFDGSTGIVSNPVMQDFDAYYGGSFSPDGSKIYGLTFGFQSHMYQFDLSAPNPSATKTLLDTGALTINFSTWEDLKLGPDGKIYFGPLNASRKNIGRINNPNLAGLACGYQNIIPGIDYMSFGAESVVMIGLPNEVVTASPEGSGQFRVLMDTTLCNFPTVQGLPLAAPGGYTSYRWDNNAIGRSRTIFQPGTYWVRYNTGYCNFITDTFYVNGGIPPLDILYDGNVLSTSETYMNYQWYYQGVPVAGANGAQYSVTDTGWYSVVVSNGEGCSDSAGYYVGQVTGIYDVDALRKQINVFPNPANDRINVQAPLPLRLELIDVQGKIILSAAGNKLDIPAVPAGFYFLNIRDSEGNLIVVRKVAVHRQ
jgi:hypothetical protein